MKNATATGTLAALALMGAWIGEASASYPTGVWTHVDKVVFDNPADPTTIEIHGALMVHNGDLATKYPGYSDPALGYMYYTCPAGQKAVCQMEWLDIQKNIGTATDQCVGFGSDMLPPGTFRKACDPPANPDPYPIAMGVVGGFSPCQVIKDFLATNPTDGCGGSGAGGAGTTTSSSGTTTGSGGSGGSAGTSTSGSGTTTGSNGTTASGTGGSGSSSGGEIGGCSCTVDGASREGVSLGGLALAIAFGGLALRRKAAGLRVR